MASTSETGHAKNIANFQDLQSFCTGYGAAYNPTNAAISMAALTTKHTESLAAQAALNSSQPTLTNAVNQREIIFTPLEKLATRLQNAVAASDVSAQFINDVKTLTRKLQGRRATPKKTPTPDNPATPENESSKSISASQLSYDSQVENFSKLIELLSAQPAYKPNETELTTAELTNLLTSMKAANTTVVDATTVVSNTRISRNNVLYNETTGMLKVAETVKQYVKSVFTASSPQYKQISKIKFRPFSN